MSPPKLIDIFCCPDDHSKLHLASDTVVKEINALITARRLRNRAGRLLEEPIDGGLIRAKGDFMYPIARGIPLLLHDEAIPIEPA